MNIIEFFLDNELTAGIFKKLETWFHWFVLVAAAYAVPAEVVARAFGQTPEKVLSIFQTFTGRTKWPSKPCHELWILSGRKSGKSRIISVIIIFEIMVRTVWQAYLSPGERCIFPAIAIDRQQARIIFDFCRGILKSNRHYRQMIINETKEEIELSNGAVLRVMTADKASSRGPLYGILAADEVAFWRSGDSFANPDSEVFSAIEPGLYDGAMIVSISSVAGEMGLLYQTYKEHYGRDDDPVLVWKSDTKSMNPLYSQSKIDRLLAKDMNIGRAEYFSEFRTDLSGLYNSLALDDCRVSGQMSIPYQAGNQYHAFVDMSGGKKDSHSLAISHREKSGKIIIDVTREIIPSPKVKPSDVCKDFAGILKSYNLTKAVGDSYGAQWVVESFSKENITLEKAESNSSEIYLDCIGPFSDRQVSLPDDDRLLGQLKALMRRIVPGGKDKVLSGKSDRSHSDLSNAVCGSIWLCAHSHHGGGVFMVSDSYFYDCHGHKAGERDSENLQFRTSQCKSSWDVIPAGPPKQVILMGNLPKKNNGGQK